MKKYISLILFLFIIFALLWSSDSQEKTPHAKKYKVPPPGPEIDQWARTYGGWNDDTGFWVIEQKASEGYVLGYATFTFDAGGTEFGDIWIFDLTSNGKIEWQRTYGGPDEELLYGGIKETQDGGYIVAGFTKSFGPGQHDFWILKLASNGNIEWQYAYGGSDMDFPYSVQITSDGGYIVAGTTYSFGAGDGDFWILKLTSSGKIEWQKTYGGPLDERAKSILLTEDGGYIVSGYTDSFGSGESDYWILKLTSSGDIEWQRTYGGRSSEYPTRTFDRTSDGGYIVAGWSGSFSDERSRIWILKLTSSGDIRWQRTDYGSLADWGGQIQETSDGGYIVAAKTESFGAGFYSGWILKLKSNGDIEWQHTYGGNNMDSVAYIQEISEGGYIVGGSTASFGTGGWDLWMLKLSPKGTIGKSCEIIGSANAKVSKTSVIPMDTDAVPRDTHVTPQGTNVKPGKSNAITQLLCHSDYIENISKEK